MTTRPGKRRQKELDATGTIVASTPTRKDRKLPIAGRFFANESDPGYRPSRASIAWTLSAVRFTIVTRGRMAALPWRA
jgi:hypothetical protein